MHIRLYAFALLFLFAVGVSHAVTLPSNIITYVPISLSNSQGSAFSYNSQVMIAVNALAYKKLESPSMQNLEFFYANGSIIPSWMQGNSSLSSSGATQNAFSVGYTSTNVLFWLRIAPANTFLSQGSSNTVYMGFASNSTNLLSNTLTGEAPQLSSAYGQYDDGANVFNFYMNAKSVPSLIDPGSITAYQGGVVGNSSQLSIVYDPLMGNAIDVTPNTTLKDTYYFMHAPGIPSNFVLTQWTYSSGGATDQWLGAINSSTMDGYSAMPGDGGNGFLSIYVDSSRSLIGNAGYSYPYNAWISSGLIFTSSGSMHAYASNGIGLLPGGNIINATSTLYSTFNTIFFAPFVSGTYKRLMGLILARTYPPGGVMAQASFGTAVSAPTISLSNTLNPGLVELISGSPSDHALVSATCTSGDTCAIYNSSGSALASATSIATLPYNSLPLGYSTLYAKDTSAGLTSGNVHIRRISVNASITITLSNSHSAAVAANTPLSISINATAYPGYVSNSLNNTVVYFKNGTVAYSWIEGNLLNEQQQANTLYTSNDVLIWFKSPGSSAYLPADAGSATTNTIYLGFAPLTARLVDGNYIGEAPQLSCSDPTFPSTCSPVGGASSYGQYDNGNNVFTYYVNFAGASCPAGWSCSATTISNSISVPAGSYAVTTGTYGQNASRILDFEGYIPTAANANNAGAGYFSSPYYNTGGEGDNWEINTGNGDCNSGYACAETWTTSPSQKGVLPSTSIGYSVWSIYLPSSSSTTLSSRYGAQNSLTILGTNNGIPNTKLPIGFSNNQNAGQPTPLGPFNWLRLRIYPPSGDMPSASFSAVTTTLSVNISSSTTLPATLNSGQAITFNAIPSGGSGVYSSYNFLVYNSVTNAEVANYLTQETENTIISNIPYGLNRACSIAVSPSGTYAYVLNYNSGNIVILDTGTNSITGAISNGFSSPRSVAFSPSGTYAYVTNYGSSNVVIINTATNSVTGSIPGLSYPWGVAFSPSGTYAYVSDFVQSNVSIIDTATNSITNSINSGFYEPFGIAFSPSGSYAYVTNYAGNAVIINTATNSVTDSISGHGISDPSAVAFSPSGTYAYIGNSGNSTILIVNSATNTVDGTVSGSIDTPYGIAFSPSGSLAYAVSYSSANIYLIGTKALNNSFTYSIPSLQDGSTLYASVSVTDSQGVSATSKHTGILTVASPSTTTTTTVTTTVTPTTTAGGCGAGCIHGSGGTGASSSITTSSTTIKTTLPTTTLQTTTLPTTTMPTTITTTALPIPPIEVTVKPAGETTPQLCNDLATGYNVTYTSLGATFQVGPGISGCFNMTAINATTEDINASNSTMRLLDAVNFTASSNVRVNATMHYACSLPSSDVAPFILSNGTWDEIRPFTVDPSACTVTFAVPSDPVIALFDLLGGASQSTAPTTSANQQEQSGQQQNYPILPALAVIAAILILLALYTRRRGRRLGS